MSRQIIESPPPGPEPWLRGLGEPALRRLLAWEQAQAEACLADVFGYHALQASGLGLDLLAPGPGAPRRSTWSCCRTRSSVRPTRTPACARSSAC